VRLSGELTGIDVCLYLRCEWFEPPYLE